MAISQNNQWVALDQQIYQFDGGKLTFFQDVGYCWDVELSAEGDFFFCYDELDHYLRIYKNEPFPTWAKVVIAIASVCLLLSLFLCVFCYRKHKQ